MHHFSKQRIQQLRATFDKFGIDGIIIPSWDSFKSEFVPESERRLEWLTGFNGSYGVAVVLRDKAVLFTDGRYTIQAEQQLDTELFDIHNVSQTTSAIWLSKHLKENQKIGMVSWLHTASDVEKHYAMLGDRVKALADNPVDNVWKERAKPTYSDVMPYPLQYAGISSAEKVKSLCHTIEENAADGALITAPDSVCWLLNIRGHDIQNTPLIHTRALVEKGGRVSISLDSLRLSEEIEKAWQDRVACLSDEAFLEKLTEWQDKKLMTDPATTPYALWQQCPESVWVKAPDPCELPKACKNEIELKGIREAHCYDGAAVVNCLHWLFTQLESGETVTELNVIEKMRYFRSEQPDFIEPSFDTICGFKANGAIVHYRVSEESNQTITGNGVLLIDSGGQYWGGTTDITRTVAIGSPTQEQRHHFTLVLKGHIALARAVFPEGTSGSALDSLARQYLWQEGKDYAHGTGHGVGCCLNVHEGPQRISSAANNVALKPGMVLSNEPGFYQAGDYGIRIENLVEVVETETLSGARRYFGFRNLTMAPLDMRLVDETLLTPEEALWLENYHADVVETLKPLLSDVVYKWMIQKIA